ncbi:hypothetical protein [Streptomyces sp. NPDC096132]|uniref:hypothetical protein n=1 Tax=Streptomyces sp. NPDC096132 TaxID=3366075 RepID=UPI003813E17D
MLRSTPVHTPVQPETTAEGHPVTPDQVRASSFPDSAFWGPVAGGAAGAIIGALCERWRARRSRRELEQDRGVDHQEKAAREQRGAQRDTWRGLYDRVEDLLVRAGRIQLHAQESPLHHGDDAADLIAPLLMDLRQAAQEAHGDLAEALQEVDRDMTTLQKLLLPERTALEEFLSPATAGNPAEFFSLLTQAAEQARLTDALATTLQTARAALRAEWATP